MRSFAWAVLVSLEAAGCGSFAPRAADPRPETGSLTRMPLALESRFALSALPPGLRADASVFVLDPASGYILARQGSNGQSCFVERTEWEREDYRDDLYAALCYDAAGAKAQMQVWFDVARLRAGGASPADLRRQVEARFAEGAYRAPDRSGFAYMTAPVMRAYASHDVGDKTVVTMSMPHVMYYAPNVSDADVGGVVPPPLGPYPYVAHRGPHGYFMQFFGETERRAIVARERELLDDLCAYRSVLCLSGA
jgi:hypothetical protein